MGQFTYELNLPPGINSDDTTVSAKGKWADCNNVRFVLGKPQTIGGYGSATTQLAAGHCRTILPYNAGFGTGASTVKVAYATVVASSATSQTCKLYVSDVLGAATDITPASGFTASGQSVSLAAWGTDLLAAPRMGTLFQSVSLATATEVTQAPDQIVRMLVATVQRQVLAFGCTQVAGGFNGRAIRCCNYEDLTNWTPTSSNHADEFILDGQGMIVAAEWVGDYPLVWTEAALYRGEHVGDPELEWRFVRIATVVPPLNQKCVTVADGAAFWFGRDSNFYACDASGAVTRIPCPISRELLTNLNVTRDASTGQTSLDVVTMGQIKRFGEIWLLYPDTRDGSGSSIVYTCSRYVAFNKETGAWFRGTWGAAGTREAMADISGFRPDLIQNGGILMVGGAINVTVQRHENDTSGSRLAWHIQSADFYMDGAKRRVRISGIRPDFEYQGTSVSLTLFVRDYPQSSATTKGPYTLTSGATKKDLHLSGKLVAVKFSETGSANSYARLGNPLFDGVTMGER